MSQFCPISNEEKLQCKTETHTETEAERKKELHSSVNMLIQHQLDIIVRNFVKWFSYLLLKIDYSPKCNYPS